MAAVEGADQKGSADVAAAGGGGQRRRRRGRGPGRRHRRSQAAAGRPQPVGSVEVLRPDAQLGVGHGAAVRQRPAGHVVESVLGVGTRRQHGQVRRAQRQIHHLAVRGQFAQVVDVAEQQPPFGEQRHDAAVGAGGQTQHALGSWQPRRRRRAHGAAVQQRAHPCWPPGKGPIHGSVFFPIQDEVLEKGS